MKKRISFAATLILSIMLFCLTSLSVKAEGEYTFTNTNDSRFVFSGTKFYSTPSGGEVVFTYPMSNALPITGVCNETGWYRTTFNNNPVYVNPKDTCSNQDAYCKLTIGLKAANKKVGKTLHDGTKLFTIGTAANGMPIYSIYPNIAAPDYLVNAVNATGITPEDSDFTKIDKVRAYIVSHTTYDDAYATTIGMTTYSALTTGRAVCAGFAEATNTLLFAVGVDSYFLSGGRYGTNDSHAWNGVWVDGTMYYFEPQMTTGQSPLTQTWDLGKGYPNTCMTRFNTADKVCGDQPNLMEAAGFKKVN